MLIRFVESIAGKGFVYAKGEVIDLPPAQGMKFITDGIAVPANDPDAIEPDRPLRPVVQEVKKRKTRPQKRN